MSKKTVFTTITPIPTGVSRETVMSTLRNHVEMIDLNPLVINREPCKAPSFATPEEYHAIWYEITDRISYLPGGMAKGSVTYHGCFHDLAEGLQTHVYAPLGLDIRSRWVLGGNLPGEPVAPVELGLGIPKVGLYLREDVEMKCNIMMISFVKKNLKRSHSTLVDRLLEKAKIVEVDKSNASFVTQPGFLPHRQSTISSNPGTPAMSIASPSMHNSRLSTLSHSSDGGSSGIYGQHISPYQRSHSPNNLGIGIDQVNPYGPPQGHVQGHPQSYPHGYQQGHPHAPYPGQAEYPPAPPPKDCSMGQQGGHESGFVELPSSQPEKANGPVELPS
jgi:hypothetical protein